MNVQLRRFLKLHGCLLFILLLISTLNFSLAQNCGSLNQSIRFAGLDWPSARFHSATARYILNVGFSCDTEIISGSTVPLIKSLTEGEIDVVMEVWKNNAPTVYNKALEQKEVLELGILMEGIEAFFVPRYVVEGDAERGIEAVAPGLRSVSDLEQYASLFKDPDQPSKGRFYNCVAGWKCQRMNTLKYHAYKLDESYTNFSAESLMELEADVEEAYRKGEPILTYYWGPTWILGHFDMMMLDEPAHDEGVWQTMQTALDEERLTDQAVAYPRNIVTIAINKNLAEQAPQGALDFLTNYQMDQSVVSTYLAVIRNEVLEPEEVALIFLRDMPELWMAWLPADVAMKIQESLTNSAQ